jgi:putative membrane protein
MNRHLRWAFALALLPIAACSSNPPPAPVAVAPAPPALAAVDQTFANAAASSDATEIQAAQLAKTKTKVRRITQFADRMIADHTKTTQQLTTILQSKGATPTATPGDLSALQAETGRKFDRDYMRGQVTAHIAAVKLFQDEIANGQDADVKSFAQATLPTIQDHLKMARAISGYHG